MTVAKITQALTNQVREVAWSIYLQRKWAGKPGTPEEDWFEAEKQVRPFKPDVELAAYCNYLSRVRRDEPGDMLNDWLSAEASQSDPYRRLRRIS